MTWIQLSLISAIFSATAAIVQKKMLRTIDPILFSFLTSLPILAGTMYYYQPGVWSTLTVSMTMAFVFKTFLSALFFVAVMYSLKNNELSSALPLLALTPGLVAVSAFFFLGEKLLVLEIIGLVCLLIGPYLLELRVGEPWTRPFTSIARQRSRWFIIAALALSVATSLLDKYFLKTKLTPNNFLFLQHFYMVLIFSVFLLVALLFKKVDLKVQRRTLSTWTAWAGLILIGAITVIYRAAQIFAIKKADSIAMVLSIKRLSVFFAVVIGGRLLAEKSLLRKSIATAIIIAGTLCIIRFN